MKISATIQKGIRIDIEAIIDWARLELIVIDASKPTVPLVEALASKMNVEADWREYVMPDLTKEFNEQLHYVHSEIKRIRSRNADSGEIFITKENVGQWYGALNQARISLEAEHGISKFDNITDEQRHNLNEGVQSAILRYHFYTILQSAMLDSVMI